MNKTSAPLVSVCITTYNHERYIAQCLQSALMQHVDVSIEILVGDDASTDGNETIIREITDRFPDVIRYFRHAERKGPSGNMEYLIREARGKYIAHLDGDDFWQPGKLVRQVALLDAHADVLAVYTNAFCIFEEGLPSGTFSNYRHQRIHVGDLIRRGNFLNHSSMLYRSELRWALIEGSVPRLDYHLHLLLARHGALGYLPEPLTVYRVSSSTSIMIHANDYVRELYWAALCDTQPPLVSPLDLNAGMAEFMRSIFFRSIRMRSTQLLKTWWPRVLAKAPAGRTRLLLQTFWAIFRTGITETAAWACRKITCNTMRVLYPR